MKLAIVVGCKIVDRFQRNLRKLFGKWSVDIVSILKIYIFVQGRGNSGLLPFPKDVENAILKVLRRKQIWKCFRNKQGIKIGSKGFSRNGYWEDLELSQKVLSTQDTFRYAPKTFISVADLSISSTNKVNQLLKDVFKFKSDLSSSSFLNFISSMFQILNDNSSEGQSLKNFSWVLLSTNINTISSSVFI